jgi:hypothetical protein
MNDSVFVCALCFVLHLDCQQQPTTSSSAADRFWEELTAQSWRTELDYGLPGTEAATQAAAAEQILILAATHEGVAALAAAAAAAAVAAAAPTAATATGGKHPAASSDGTGSTGAALSEGVIAVVTFQGWNQGQQQQQLKNWKQLQPQLTLLQPAAVSH